jgi:hypothetical protein
LGLTSEQPMHFCEGKAEMYEKFVACCARLSIPYCSFVRYQENEMNEPLHGNGHLPNITHVGCSHSEISV